MGISPFQAHPVIEVSFEMMAPDILGFELKGCLKMNSAK